MFILDKKLSYGQLYVIHYSTEYMIDEIIDIADRWGYDFRVSDVDSNVTTYEFYKNLDESERDTI